MNTRYRFDISKKRKLTYEQASEIRLRYIGGGWTWNKLAAEYKVSRGVIAAILQGRTYHPLDPIR